MLENVLPRVTPDCQYFLTRLTYDNSNPWFWIFLKLRLYQFISYLSNAQSTHLSNETKTCRYSWYVSIVSKGVCAILITKYTVLGLSHSRLWLACQCERVSGLGIKSSLIPFTSIKQIYGAPKLSSAYDETVWQGWAGKAQAGRQRRSSESCAG